MSDRAEKDEPRHVLPPEERTAPPKASRASISAKASAAAAGAQAAAVRKGRKGKK